MQPHAFWQDFDIEPDAAPFTTRYPARMPDGRILHLPIRPLGDSEHALASLIVNQASFAVERALAEALAERLRPAAPEVVVGLPTLGLTLARAVAERLGHSRYVPLGTSRKFWYDEALAADMSSITSPGAVKRLYLDPRMLPLLDGRRVALIDDVISTGRSITAGLDVLASAEVAPFAIGAAMLQTDRWRPALAALGMESRVHAVFATPMLNRRNGGWEPIADGPG
jgi:adenine/guanine phosphoribosyltransferase-like PRPP-binding protein